MNFLQKVHETYWEYPYLFTIGGLVIVISLILLYSGALQQVRFERRRFGPNQLVYKEYQGVYRKIGGEFGKIQEENKENSRDIFKFSNMFAHYLDDPNGVEDESKCRALLGFIVNRGQDSKISSFIEQNPSFKVVDVPVLNSVTYTHQWRKLLGMLNIIIYVKKAYPALQRFLQTQNLERPCSQGIMEEYTMGTCSFSILMNYFYGRGANILDVSTIPEPAKKFKRKIE